MEEICSLGSKYSLRAPYSHIVNKLGTKPTTIANVIRSRPRGAPGKPDSFNNQGILGILPDYLSLVDRAMLLAPALCNARILLARALWENTIPGCAVAVGPPQELSGPWTCGLPPAINPRCQARDFP